MRSGNTGLHNERSPARGPPDGERRLDAGAIHPASESALGCGVHIDLLMVTLPRACTVPLSAVGYDRGRTVNVVGVCLTSERASP